MDRHARALALFAFLFLLLTPLAAQAPPPADAGAAQPAAPPPVPAERSSPRATLTTFLEAFYAEGEALDGEDPMARAAACLDLSDLPSAIRARRGEELAIALKAVLDRVERIDLDAVSAAPDAEPWRLPVEDLGAIVLAPDPRGEWRFTRDTVARVPTLLRALQRRSVVAGVKEGPQTVGQWLRARLPERLQGRLFILESWQWLGLLLLLLVGLVLERVVSALLRQSLTRYLGKVTAEHLDHRAVRHALRPAGLLAASLLWLAGIYWLDLPVQALTVATVATRFVAISALVWTAYRLADVVSAVLTARSAATVSKFDDLLVPLVRTTMKLIIAAFGLVFIADNLDVDISSLLAGIGIGGIAIALAAQDAVKNVFGSLMVILDRPFAVGDAVKIGSVEGTIEEVGFRSTRIRTFYNSLITLPNANLISTAVDNLGARAFRRWRTLLSLTYDTSPAKIEAFCEGVRELIRQHPHTRKDGFQVCLNELSASSLDVLVHVFFETQDWSVELASRHRLALDILRLAESLGVDFAFPTQTVHLERDDDAEPSTAGAGTGGALADVAAAHQEGRAAARALAPAQRDADGSG